MIRVLLVDDQELVRAGLRRILQTTDEIDVVAECSDGDEVVATVREHRPDVVVMDVRMKRVDGVEATKRLRSDETAPPVLVLTTFDDDELLSGALRAGAAGFQLKDAPGEEIVRARALLRQGGPDAGDAAETALAAAEALVERTGAGSRAPLLHLARAELAAARSDLAARERELREAHRLFTEMGAPLRADLVARELGT